MKFTKILALLLVAVMALGIFASCEEETVPVDPNAPPKALKISEIYKDGVDFDALMDSMGYGDKLYTSVEDYTGLDGKNVQSKSGKLMYYRNDNLDPAKYVVHNFETNTDVFSVAVDDTYSIRLSSNYFTVVTYEANDISLKTTVYNVKGEKLYETFGDYTVSSSYGNLIQIGTAIYEVTYNDELVKLVDVPMFFDVDVEDLVKTENGFVMVDDEYVVYYDNQLNVTAECVAPGNYDDVETSLLADGKAFMVATREEDAYGDTYDVIYTGEEYNGTTSIEVTKKMTVDYFIFNPKDGKTTQVTTLDNYLIEYVDMNALTMRGYPIGFYDMYASGIANIVRAYKITNRRIDESVPVLLNMDNDANVKGQLNALVANQYYLAQPSGNYFVVETAYTTYILNKDGSVAKKFATDYVDATEFGYYDSNTKIVYKKNFEVLKDLSSYNVIESGNTCMVYYNYDANGNACYYMLSDAGEKQIALGANTTFVDFYELMYNEVYEMKVSVDGTTKYRYYNYQGTMLFESDYEYATYITTDSFVILKATGYVNGEYKTFYKKIK
jgi:hypothetical protein